VVDGECKTCNKCNKLWTVLKKHNQEKLYCLMKQECFCGQCKLPIKAAAEYMYEFNACDGCQFVLCRTCDERSDTLQTMDEGVFCKECKAKIKPEA
jgi:hypothetical protein